MTEPIRRSVRARQVETMQRLLDAVVEELAETPYAEVTTRTIAKRAEVSPATFYTYFSSKEHLLAAVFRERMLAVAAQEVSADQDPRVRLEDALGRMVATVFTDRGLQKGWTLALLVDDPDVHRLQQDYAQALTQLLTDALGPDVPGVVAGNVLLLLAGALVAAGQDLLPFPEVPRVVGDATALMLRGL